MKDIYTILGEIGLTVPEDKKTTFDNAVKENYKTVAELDKVVKARDDYKSQLDKTAIHKIQHALQHIDDRAAGSSVEYWAKKNVEKLHEMQNNIVDMKAERASLLANADNELRRRIREVNNADWYDINSDGKTEQDILRDKLLADDTTGIYKKSLDMDFEIQKLEAELEYFRSTATAEDMYYNTAGEIEARETANRLRMTAEERAGKMPDLGWERAVFADDSAVGYDVATDNNGNKVVVMLDNILKNVKNNVHQAIANKIAQNIGQYYRIIESGQKVYIGKDLPNEYTQSVYTKNLIKNHQTKILKAKNQASQNLGEMIEIATDRVWTKNIKPKHAIDAKYGWYHYTTRFAIPKYDSYGNGNGFKIFSADLLIRNDTNGKKYLYDILNIKEEKSSSLPTSWIAKIRNNSSTSLDTSVSYNVPSVNNNFMQNLHDNSPTEKLSVKFSTENISELKDVYSVKRTSPAQRQIDILYENRNLKQIISLIDQLHYSTVTSSKAEQAGFVSSRNMSKRFRRYICR